MKNPLWLIVLVLLLCSDRGTAQPAYPSTLLWRISGNGLKKPSYLWGTIHLQDRRVFAFSDSLYHFLYHTEVFAMELDVEKASEELIPFVLGKDTSAFLYSVLPDTVFLQIAPVLERELHKPARTIRRKEAWLYLQLRPYRVRRDDDMPQPMDLYLQQLAQKHGKLLLGIEDLSDQFNMEEILNGPFDARGFLQTDTEVTQQTEEMVQLYVRQDLNGIERLTASDSIYEKRTLLRRNRKMAYRMDSLAKVRPTFFAIGAGHLPGAQGVLALLRKRGYRVTPVLGGRVLPAGEAVKEEN